MFAATSFACFFLIAASAGAVPLKVTPGGGDLAPCTDASPCSLTRAVAIADPEPGVVTIDVSAGQIQLPPGGLDAIAAGLDGLWIRGSGPATTVITGDPDESSLIRLGAGDIRLSELAIEASRVPPGGAAVDVTSGGARFEHTSLNVEGAPGHFAIHGESNGGVDVEVGNSEIEDAVTAVGSGPFVPGTSILAEGNANGGLAVHDSTMLLRDIGSTAGAIRAGGTASLAVDKTVIVMTAPPGLRGDGQGFAVMMDPAITGYADARVADSIIVGGGGGVWAAANGAGPSGSSLNVDVDRDTIDVGEVGVVDLSPRLDIQLGARDEGAIEMGVRDSVFIDAVKRYDVGGFKCFSPAFANYAFAIAVTACNRLVTFNDDPASIFATTDWDTALSGGIEGLRSRVISGFTPLQHSVIVDSGTGVGAPGLDIAGNERIAPADVSCLPVPPHSDLDRGAVEWHGVVKIACNAAHAALTGLTVTPRSPRSGRAGRAIIRYRLSHRAVVRIDLVRPARGRLVSGECTPRDRGNRGRRLCWLRRHLGTKTFTDVKGLNSHRLGLLRTGHLEPGFHRLRLFVDDRFAKAPRNSRHSLSFRIRGSRSLGRGGPCNRGCRREPGR